jgi:hypothetical protein
VWCVSASSPCDFPTSLPSPQLRVMHPFNDDLNQLYVLSTVLSCFICVLMFDAPLLMHRIPRARHAQTQVGKEIDIHCNKLRTDMS